MVDTAKLITTAQRLITANGRSVTFVQYNETLTDTSKPWNGPTDPRATPASTLVVNAVFVEPSSATQLGIATAVSDLIKNSEKIMLVSAGANQSLDNFQEVIDESITWKIETIEELRPGSATLLHFVGVRR